MGSDFCEGSEGKTDLRERAEEKMIQGNSWDEFEQSSELFGGNGFSNSELFRVLLESLCSSLDIFPELV